MADVEGLAVPTIKLVRCNHHGVFQPAGVCWFCYEDPSEEDEDLAERAALGLYDDDED